MKITIITAVYNRPKGIEDLYNSIKKQTHKDWEWIICDDHSDILKYHQVKKLVLNDKRVKIIRNTENRKQAYSRNQCIRLAKGNVICNIDSDDDIPENRLEIINDSFEREKDCDVLYGGWTLVRGKEKKYFSPEPFDADRFFEQNLINNNAAAWKKSCNLFYDEDFNNGCDDYSMWLSAVVRGLRFMTADVNLIFWKNEEGCQSVDKKKELEIETVKVKYFWKKPTISVIMPTYNRTKYLREAIRSVINQTFTNWELLVVDDGSYNNGGLDIVEIIDKLKDKRIRYIRKDNGGLSSALNYGLDRANGDFIALLDDDDLYLSSHLKILYKTIIKEKALVVYGQTIQGKIEGNNIEIIKNICEPITRKEHLLITNKFTTCSVLIDKSILYQNGLYFDETLKTHMDWDFWMVLIQLTNFKFNPISTSIYRIHKDNMLAADNERTTWKNTISNLEDMNRVQFKHMDF